MTSIDDLRRTLDSHADVLTDTDVAGRAPAVHQRVRVVRRRRKVALAGTAAAVIAVAGGVALLPGSGDGSAPAPATRVVNVVAPATLTATGYTYGVADTAEGENGTASIKLPASDAPRLVSWATSGADQDVTIRGNAVDQALHLDDADFTNWIYVAPGPGSTRVSVEAAEGEAGLAVYELTDERPEGYTKDGVTFRQDVAGGELIGAYVGDPGEASFDLSATSTGPMIWVQIECEGGPSDARYSVERNGKPFMAEGGCTNPIPVDMSGLSGMGYASRVGQQLDLSVRMVSDGALVDDPTLKIAIGVYSAFERSTGEDRSFPAAIEDGGHAWQLTGEYGSQGADTLEATAPTGKGQVYAVVISQGVTSDVALTGNGTFFLQPGSGTAAIIDPGQVVRFEAKGEAPADSNMRIAFYQRAD